MSLHIIFSLHAFCSSAFLPFWRDETTRLTAARKQQVQELFPFLLMHCHTLSVVGIFSDKGNESLRDIPVGLEPR